MRRFVLSIEVDSLCTARELKRQLTPAKGNGGREPIMLFAMKSIQDPLERAVLGNVLQAHVNAVRSPKAATKRRSP